MPHFVNGSELLKRLKKELRQAQKADLAVAFWGEGTVEQLGLSSDTKLRIICNLSSGGTNPNVIRTLIKQGAKVRQLKDLHAKIGISGSLSFLGSSNMSSKGLGFEETAHSWQEANVVYDRAHPEIVKLFAKFWKDTDPIQECDLARAQTAWNKRRETNAIIEAMSRNEGLVDVLRKRPKLLDDMNVKMVVYLPIEECDEFDRAEATAKEHYGEMFTVYRNWKHMTKDAANAYLVSFYRPSRGPIAGATLYRRNTEDFPDFKQDGEDYHLAHEVKDINGIAFETSDATIIRKAFYTYLEHPDCREKAGKKNFLLPISVLAPHLPPAD